MKIRSPEKQTPGCKQRLSKRFIHLYNGELSPLVPTWKEWLALRTHLTFCERSTSCPFYCTRNLTSACLQAILPTCITMLLFTLAICLPLVASIASSVRLPSTSQTKVGSSNAPLGPWSVRNYTTPTVSVPMRPATAFWDDDLASPADFQKAADKGGALICALQGTDQTAGLLLKDKRNPPSAASTWHGDLKAELQSWYWHTMNPTSKGCRLNTYWQVTAALQALGLDGNPKSEGGDNVCHRIEHWDPTKLEDGHQVPAINQWYAVDENNYRATKAHFEFITNTKGGGRLTSLFHCWTHLSLTISC